MRLRFVILATVLASSNISCLADSFPVQGGSADFSGSGVLTATAIGNGRYRITDISGSGVTGLVSRDTYRNNDNILLPGEDTLLDKRGFAFTDTQGDTDYTVKLFASGTQTYKGYVLDSDGVEQLLPMSFQLDTETSSVIRMLEELSAGESRTFGYDFAATAAATPEPSTIALLGTGLLGIAGLLHRRRE